MARFFEARWTFDFAGEHPVIAYGPAIFAAGAAHTIQDGYTHVLRDDEMRIVAVANFASALSDSYSEGRDGPTHSDRLDECDPRVEFDRMRIEAARSATHDLIGGLFSPGPGIDASTQRFDGVLDRVYELREDCTLQNNYCDSAWVPIANEALTEPISLSPCSSYGTPDETPSLFWSLLGLAFVMRRRKLK